jgi:hypothetical protein
MRRDEEHSSYNVVFHDSTNAERTVGLALAAQPEYRRFRTLAKTIARFNDPPFLVVKNDHRQAQPNWRELLGWSASVAAPPYTWVLGSRAPAMVSTRVDQGRGNLRQALGNSIVAVRRPLGLSPKLSR